MSSSPAFRSAVMLVAFAVSGAAVNARAQVGPDLVAATPDTVAEFSDEIAWLAEAVRRLAALANTGDPRATQDDSAREILARLAVDACLFGPSLREMPEWSDVEQLAESLPEGAADSVSTVGMVRAQLLGDRSRTEKHLDALHLSLQRPVWLCGNGREWAMDEEALLRAAWHLEGGRPAEALDALRECEGERFMPLGLKEDRLYCGLHGFALLSLGRDAEAQPDLQHLVDLYPDHLWGRRARVLLSRDGVLVEPSLDRLAARAGAHERDPQRLAAVRAIGAHGFHGAFEWLRDDATDRLNSAHAEAMALLDDPRATRWLEKTAREDTGYVGWTALLVLGPRPDPQTDALLDAVLTRLEAEGKRSGVSRYLVVDALRTACGGGPELRWETDALRGGALARTWRKWLASANATQQEDSR